MSLLPDSYFAEVARPNVLFVMTDQQRFDTIAALGASPAHTPNLDRLVARGFSCTNAYSTCPVCVPARYSIMTGCEPSRTGWFGNWQAAPNVGARCGSYLPETMARQGYRTWGLGKFHTQPRHEPLGFEVHEHSEELWPDEETFRKDDYVAWLRERAPEFAHLEQVHGERTDMYYVPQTRAQPAHLCGEAWLADRACEEIGRDDGRPYFGFVSFVQPHPPIAPPIPYNRMFDPDAMPSPVLGDPAIDKADDYLAWMNHAIYAEDIAPPQARQLRARYAGAISFVDECIGRILDAVEARGDAANTLICFFADHGDHMGDHGAWQKESFFEASCRIPMLVSWPRRWPGGQRWSAPVTLTDLFALATAAAKGSAELRDGYDLARSLDTGVSERERCFGLFGAPGTRYFKAMVREGNWKYLWLANGGREFLFNIAEDPSESRCYAVKEPATMRAMRATLISQLAARELTMPALKGGELRSMPFEIFPRERIKQFARGITDFGQEAVASDSLEATGKFAIM
jgi:arylsulfatase